MARLALSSFVYCFILKKMSEDHLPTGKELKFVAPENPFLQAAKACAQEHSLDPQHPTGAVVVKDGKVLGKGANGSSFHSRFGCPRKLLKIKSGTGYWMCPGCSTKNHAEQKALADCLKNGKDPKGADIYLWGHSYCCKWCWAAMEKHGIREVFLASQTY